MDDQKQQAKVTLLKLLAASPKSRRDLKKKLELKGFRGEVIDSALEEFERLGILSDRAYAKDIVTKFTDYKPSGKRKISFELKRKGISTKLREEVLETVDRDAELDRAREVARAKWERLREQSFEKKQKKVYDFLMRRGFEYQDCRTAIEEIKKSERDED